MAATQVYAFIAVSREEPYDAQQYRHTALYFKFDSGEKPILIHTTGPSRDYVVEMRQDYDPFTSTDIAGRVEVGRLMSALTKANVIALVLETQPDNESYEYNCHTWVERVLKSFEERGLISSETYAASIDKMLDITLEAPL